VRQVEHLEHLLREVHERLEQLVRTQYFGRNEPAVVEVSRVLAETGYERAHELTELVITAYTSIFRARVLVQQAKAYLHRKMVEAAQRGGGVRS